MSRPSIFFFFSSSHTVVGFFFNAWSLESHQCQNWRAYQYVSDRAVFYLTPGTSLQLCRSIVSAFIARWLTKTSRCTRLLRERDTVTVSVSPDRSPIWKRWRTITPGSISLITLSRSEKVAKTHGDQARGRGAVPGMIEWSAEIWWAPTAQWFAAKFREILFSIPDTELKGG